ncbi:unnamed protein product [Closterium sp. Naga37s-1]|nr:unnamed protein product [Closterium sp. Naga37s-1]
MGQGNWDQFPETSVAEAAAAAGAEEGAGKEAHEPMARVDAATAVGTGAAGDAVAGAMSVGAAAAGATETVLAATAVAEAGEEVWAGLSMLSLPLAAEEMAPPRSPRVSTEAAAAAEDAKAGATAAAACARTPVAAAAASTQEHGRAEGDSSEPVNGVASDAARATSKRELRAQPAPRRPGVVLGPGSPEPLLGWLLQGQPPSERVHRSSSVSH